MRPLCRRPAKTVATFRQKVAIGAFFVGKRSKQWPLFAEIVAIVSLHKQCGQIDHIVIAQFWLSCTLQNGQQFELSTYRYADDVVEAVYTAPGYELVIRRSK